MKLTTRQRDTLRFMFGGMCAYCGNPLGEKWHADHVEPVIRDGNWVRVDEPGRSHKYVGNGKCERPENDHIGNFFPACVPCNISKGAEPLEQWRGWLESRIIETLQRDSSIFRHAERFKRILIIRQPLVFWFEVYLNMQKEDGRWNEVPA